MPKLTDEQTFAAFDHDNDGRAGGSLPKAKRKGTAMAKKATKKTTKKATTKQQVQKRGDQTPEAKDTLKEQQAAAKELFQDADRAAAAGMPEGMTKEQRENQVRLGALGY